MSGLLNIAPKFIFGAGEQSDHVVRLMQWMEIPCDGVTLFDDNYPTKREGPAGLPIVGTIESGVRLCSQNRSVSMIAIGTKGAAFRFSLYQRLRARGVPLSSFAHSTVIRAPGVTLGDNVVVMAGCTLGKNVSVAPLCFLSCEVTLEHDTTLEQNVFIGPGVVTAGHVRVCKHAFVGVGAVIGPGITIRERSLVGAGAVVVSDVPPDVIAVGVPARVSGPTREGLDVPTLERLVQLGCGGL